MGAPIWVREEDGHLSGVKEGGEDKKNEHEMKFNNKRGVIASKSWT